MSKRLYVNPNGTVREEILAEREAAVVERDRNLDLALSNHYSEKYTRMAMQSSLISSPRR